MYDDPLSIGSLARCYYGVSEADIAAAMALKASCDSLCLGAALLRLGVLTREQLAELLMKQWRLRHGLVTKGDVNRLLDYASVGALRVGERLGEICAAVTHLSPAARLRQVLDAWTRIATECQ